MFLNGTAMSGQPDHHAVAGARFLGGVRTAPLYRFYAVRDAFPGLYPIPPDSDLVGASIEGELYELPEEMLYDSLMPEEPAELELGVANSPTAASSTPCTCSSSALPRRPGRRHRRARWLAGLPSVSVPTRRGSRPRWTDEHPPRIPLTTIDAPRLLGRLDELAAIGSDRQVA